MAQEYNSHLISRLYRAKTFRQLEEILEEIQNIKDPIFIYPLRDCFLLHQGKSYEHYIISALNSIESPDVISVLKEITLYNPDASDSIIIWALDAFVDRAYINDDLTFKVKAFLKNTVDNIVANKDENAYYDLHSIMRYLLASNQIDEENRNQIRSIFLNDREGGRDERTVALRYMLKIDARSELNYLIDNFETLHNNPTAEIILAETIINWQGPKSDQIKNLLKTRGGERAKDIVTADEQKQQRVEAQKKEEEDKKTANQFSNASLVKNLSDLFNKANQLAQSVATGIKIFEDTSQLPQHLEPSSDRQSIIAACTSLRSIFEKINEKIYELCGYGEEEIKMMLPAGISIQDYNKPLNRLFLYLKSINVDVNDDIYGLRKLNTAFTKLGSHQQDQEGLIKAFQNINALKLLNEEKWDQLHTHLLTEIMKSLEQLNSNLAKVVNK